MRGAKKRLWKRIAVIGSLMLTALAVLMALALLRTPSWYVPMTVPAEERQKVRNNLLDAEQAFTEGLRAGKAFVYHIYQDDVNRWISARREIYPLIDELTPPELIDPLVVFDDGIVTVAGRYKAGSIDVVLSGDIKLTFDKDAIVLKLGGVRCGSVPVVIDFARFGLGESLDREPGRVWPGSPRIWGDLVNGLRLGAEAWWKNGGISYRVTDLTVRPGQIDLSVEPLGHTGKRRKDQD